MAAILQNINLDDGMAVTEAVLKNAENLYISNIDMEGKPLIRRIGGASFDMGAFWFGVAKCEHFYGELSKNPYVCLYTETDDLTFVLNGKVCFSEDADKAQMCLQADKYLFGKYADQPEMIIAFFLTDAKAKLTLYGEEVMEKNYVLTLGDEAPVGLTIRKKTELRDRLLSILNRREEEGGDTSEQGIFIQKLYDGALLAAAECAKKLWPRMDVMQIERAVFYETYNEREDYVLLAKKLMGNAVIASPEDFTYYLNKETLVHLYEKNQ